MVNLHEEYDLRYLFWDFHPSQQKYTTLLYLLNSSITRLEYISGIINSCVALTDSRGLISSKYGIKVGSYFVSQVKVHEQFEGWVWSREVQTGGVPVSSWQEMRHSNTQLRFISQVFVFSKYCNKYRTMDLLATHYRNVRIWSLSSIFHQANSISPLPVELLVTYR